MLSIKTFEDRYNNNKKFHHVNLMGFKFRVANNKNGLLPSQWDTVKQSQLPTWKQAHNEREQEKRIAI